MVSVLTQGMLTPDCSRHVADADHVSATGTSQLTEQINTVMSVLLLLLAI